MRELRDQVRELQSELQSMTAEMRSDMAAGTHGNRGTAPRTRPGARRSTSLEEAVLRQAVVCARKQRCLKKRLKSKRKNKKNQQKKGEHAARLEEEYQLLSGKVDDQYQTKVESASKYRLRLSGIVLMNLVSNQGVVDSVDLPTVAYARPAGDSGRKFRRDAAAIGNRVRGVRPNRGGREDKGRPATRSGGRISASSERDQLRTGAPANGYDAHGLGKHLGCGRAGCDLLFAELTDIVCLAGDSRALRRREFVGLGSADKS